MVPNQNNFYFLEMITLTLDIILPGTVVLLKSFLDPWSLKKEKRTDTIKTNMNQSILRECGFLINGLRTWY